MKKIAFTVAFFLLASVPAIAYAEQTPPCAPEIETNRRATLEHDGAPGVWFHADVARCLLADVAQLPLFRERVRLLEDRLEIRDGQVERFREIVDLSVQAENRATTALDRSEALRLREREGATVWWRNPGFWFACGAVVSGVLVAVAAYVLASLGG